MKMGTKSFLFGAHQFLLHPLCVAWCWWRLYGFPWDPRLWLSFFLHDIGYIGCADMDGPEGEWHPLRGAGVMRKLFGDKWGDFCLLHSRTVARAMGRPVSDLCAADKLASAVLPEALYVAMVRLTGEIREYRSAPKHIEQTGHVDQTPTWFGDIQWYRSLQRHALAEWTNERWWRLGT